VEDVDDTNYDWFAGQMNQFAGTNVYKMPVDQHELMAMIAPRALLETGNSGQYWLSNGSNYVVARATQRIYLRRRIAPTKTRFNSNVTGAARDEDTKLRLVPHLSLKGQTICNEIVDSSSSIIGHTTACKRSCSDRSGDELVPAKLSMRALQFELFPSPYHPKLSGSKAYTGLSILS
jgi:hypothetical protein